MNDLIRDKLKEIVNLQNIIKMGKLRDRSKRSKVYSSSKYFLLIVF